jgi:hypothetical protein
MRSPTAYTLARAGILVALTATGCQNNAERDSTTPSSQQLHSAPRPR